MDITTPIANPAPELQTAFQLKEVKTNLTKHRGAIMVVGIGGMGCGFVRGIFNKYTKCEESPLTLVALNTDADDTNKGLDFKPFLIGKTSTKGIGAGGDPELGQAAFTESCEEVKQFLEACKNDPQSPLQLVVVVAGVGGGTGTGATPGFVKLCDELKIPCFPSLLLPLLREGNSIWNHALKAIKEIEEHVPSTALYDNNLAITANPDIPFEKATESIREKMSATVKGFLDISLDVLNRNADINDILTRLGYVLGSEISYTAGGVAVVHHYQGKRKNQDQKDKDANNDTKPVNTYDLLNDMLKEFNSNYCVPQYPVGAKSCSYQLKYNDKAPVLQRDQNEWMGFLQAKCLEPKGDYSIKPSQGFDNSIPEGTYSMTLLLAQFVGSQKPSDYANACKDMWRQAQEKNLQEKSATWPKYPSENRPQDTQPTQPKLPTSQEATTDAQKSRTSKTIKPGTLLTFTPGGSSTKVSPQTTVGTLANAAASAAPKVECSVPLTTQNTLFSNLMPPTEQKAITQPNGHDDAQTKDTKGAMSVVEVTEELLKNFQDDAEQPDTAPRQHSKGWDDLCKANERLKGID